MHVVLATIGTDGDVFPFVGLGENLRRRGHRVTLAGPEPYRPTAAGHGLEFVPLVSAVDVDRMLADPDLWHPLRCGGMMARWGRPHLARQYELLADLSRDADSMIVTNPGVLAARLVRDVRPKPLVTLLLQPGLLPSTIAPPAMTGGLTLPAGWPRPVGGLYWAGVDAAGYALVARHLNRLRRTLGLAPIRRLFRWWLSPDRVIGLFPEWYALPPIDWPPQLRLAGFGRFDGTHAGLPDDVGAFCSAGEPPIVCTLGTGMTHGGRLFRTFVAACEAVRARGLILSKFFSRNNVRLPETVRAYPFAPFRKLLPVCGAVVHHGGIGTTAAALEAGCPQLIVPLAWDQPDNAARVVRLGCGERLGARQRSAGHMARALVRLRTTAIRDRCREVAARARTEQDGFDVAAGLIEAVAS
jgi:UDP:flavonoid glycosyltransferase YjiC (YdhE family)